MQSTVGSRQIYGNKKLTHIYKLRKQCEAMHVMNIITESMWEMAGYHGGESFYVHA